jgi:hypothetical protein
MLREPGVSQRVVTRPLASARLMVYEPDVVRCATVDGRVSQPTVRETGPAVTP